MPTAVESVVALEPVYNILMSMTALTGADDYGGLDEWVAYALRQLDQETRATHDRLFRWLWLDSLTNAVERGPATESFPAYLAALRAQDPVVLRDKLFYWILHSPHLQVGYEYFYQPPMAPAQLLTDYGAFASFLETTLRNKVTEAAPRAIHALLNQPAQLQESLVSHLQLLWDRVVAAEWERVQPRLQATVDAFQTVPLAGLSILEAIQAVTGRDLRPAFRLEALLSYRRVRFMPQIHNGPYILWFGDHEELRIGFAAHQPYPVKTGVAKADMVSQIDQTTTVNRLKALADETRLAILVAVQEAEELGTQEIIERFGLDKSAASRHLRQLVATSLLEQRRDEGARKVYCVNAQAMAELLHVLAKLRSP